MPPLLSYYVLLECFLVHESVKIYTPSDAVHRVVVLSYALRPD